MANDKVLTFSEEFQEAIIGHCFENASFFKKCISKLEPQWFTKNLMLGNLFMQLKRAYEQEEAVITSVEEFKNFEFFLEQKADDRDKYYVLMDKCILSARMFSLEKITRQLTGFLRVSMFKESIEGAAKRYNASGFDESYDWTNRKLMEIKDATFEDNKTVMSFEHPEDWIKKQEDRREKAISTGSKILDSALGGGLFKKESCAIMAPSNVGKTTAFITIARHAISMGNNVLFMMHEGDPEEIRLRILCSFMGISTHTMFQWIKDPYKRRIIQSVSNYVNSKLVFVPYIKTGGMYVEDVIDLIKKLHEDRKAETGRGFDLIINDYPKKLRSRYRGSSKEGLYRVEAAEIYDNFNHLAVELDAHCLVAIQTNRTGLKQNNGRVDADFLLGMEEIDEAYGIAQNMPNIITLNRSPSDREKQIMRINVAKSRNSMTDIAINTRTCYNCYLVFGDKEMFDHKGLWANELTGGFLASYHQENNQKFPTEAVDQGLMDKEGIVIGESSPNVGIATPGSRISE